MIRIFLLNIIIVVVHLVSYETSVKWYELKSQTEFVCCNICFANSSFAQESIKKMAFDYPKNHSHSSGEFVQSTSKKLNGEDELSSKVINITYRNRFLFFLTGVSPPIGFVV